MIITLAGIKGGTGKSSLATNLAVVISNTGRKVLLVDTDHPQFTSSEFVQAREEEGNNTELLTSIKLTGKNILSQVPKLSQNYDFTIIDSGARDDTGQRASVITCNLALIPFRPRSFDLWVLEDTEKLIEEAQAIKEGIKAFSLLNCADPVGIDNEQSMEILKESRPIVWSGLQVGNRKVFSQAGDLGQAVTEFSRKDEKAISEITALYEFILVQSQKS